MRKNFFDNFDIKTFIITCSISILWILFSDFIVNTFLKAEATEIAQYIKGILFLFIISIVLSVFHGREKSTLRDRQDDFDRLFRQSPTPTLLVHPNSFNILEANHSALGLLKHTQSSIQRASIDGLFQNIDEWKHILQEIDSSQKGQAHIQTKLKDRYKNFYDVHLKISLFQFNQHNSYLIFIQKKGEA